MLRLPAPRPHEHRPRQSTFFGYLLKKVRKDLKTLNQELERKETRNPMQDTNHEALDQGPATPDWELKFPLGITVPLASHCIEQWINTEHVSVLESLVQSRKQSDTARIAINALRPNNRRGWAFSYRSVDYDSGEFLPFTDQLDRLKNLEFRLRDN